MTDELELDFDIPTTPENKKAMEDLKKMSKDAPLTLYGVDENGNTFPVMYLIKHPDCPDGWYEDTLQRLTYKSE